MNIKEKDLVLNQIMERKLLLMLIYPCLLNIKELELIDKIRLSAIYPEPLLKSLSGKFQLKAGSILAPAAWFFKVANTECEQKHIKKDETWAKQLVDCIENNYEELFHDEELHKNVSLTITSSVMNSQGAASKVAPIKNVPPFLCFSDAHNRSTVKKMLEDGQTLQEVISFVLDQTSKWYDRKVWAEGEAANTEYSPSKREVYRIKKAEVDDLINSLILLHNDLPRLSEEINKRTSNDINRNTTTTSSVEETSTVTSGSEIRQPEESQESVRDVSELWDGEEQTI